MRSPTFYDLDDGGLIFAAKVDAGVGRAIYIGDYRNQAFSVYGAGSITATLKVKISSQVAKPNFSAAVSATNRWAYADVALSNNAGAITDGDTGVTFGGTAGVLEFEINQNCYIWATLEIVSISGADAAVTASLALTNNQ